ncbi:hypothetical protein TNCV_1415801 [Trichonephila clavipes]|nr:hypothetical protein TNCV_1415801 [Trichonephila clavipes]
MIWVRISIDGRTDLQVYRPGSVATVNYWDAILNHPYLEFMGSGDLFMDYNARIRVVSQYVEREALIRLRASSFAPLKPNTACLGKALESSLCSV